VGRALLYLLTAAPLSALWFGLLLAGAIAIPLTAPTPLVVPVLVAYRALVWSGARLEAALVRDLLGVEIEAPLARFGAKGYLGRVRGVVGDPALWREQTFLFLRMVLGGALAVAIASAIGASAWLVALPAMYSSVDFDIGSWHVDRLGRALALVPAGVAGLAVSWFLVVGGARIWPPLARVLLAGGAGTAGSTATAAGEPTPVAHALRRALPFHAAFFVLLNAVLIAVWAFTTAGYFWPEWTLLTLGLLLAIHGWTVLVQGSWLGPRSAATRALRVHAGAAAAIGLFLVCVWAVTTAGYFWPMWPLLGLALLLGGHALTALAATRDRERLTERIDVLTTTRSGAVDAAEAELRRIERDLHDGAQARLVALGMSLGLAEQKLASDPDAALQLLTEARVGAGEALRELRDLARGIHPPILADRGLEPALAALAASAPLRVDVSAHVPERPPAPVETAAYFVAAEALANAAKHAAASHVEIRIYRLADVLTVVVVDDGRGGADPAGSGLSGIRRRVEALDGSLRVVSPPGGPTSVEAVLPCAS